MNNASIRMRTVPPAAPKRSVPAMTNVSEIEMLILTLGRVTGIRPLTTVSATEREPLNAKVRALIDELKGTERNHHRADSGDDGHVCGESA